MSFFKKLFSGRAAANKRKPKRGSSVRLEVESLEERAVPATLTVQNLANAGPDSLRQLVSVAQPGDRIDFLAGLANQNVFGQPNGTILLTTPITISNQITIAGFNNADGKPAITITGNNNTNLLVVTPNAALVTINNLYLNKGTLGGGGAAIDSESSLSLTGDYFTGNRAIARAGTGAAVQVISNVQGRVSTLDVNACNFTDNSANYGGAVAAFNSVVTIDQTEFWNNTAAGGPTAQGGGAIYVSGTEGLSVDNSYFNNNGAAGLEGGAILGQNQSVVVLNSTFVTNSADRGGAVAFDPFGLGALSNAVNFTLQQDTFLQNWTTSFGGAVSVVVALSGATDASFTGLITQSNFTTNSANQNPNAGVNDRGGGAIYVSESSVEFTEAAFTVSNSTFYNNLAMNGGGIYIDTDYAMSGTLVTLTSLTMTVNVAVNQGGGVDDESIPAYVGNSIIDGNSASQASEFSGSAYSLGFNLIGPTNGSTGWQTNANLPGFDQTNVANPGLTVPPVWNGGRTNTISLQPNSPALARGNPALAGQPDQTGMPRIAPVTVGALNQQPSPPALNPQNMGMSMLHDQTQTGNMLAGDGAAPGDAVLVSAIDGQSLLFNVPIALANGTLLVNDDGTFTYQPNSGFVGPDSFTYTLSDGFTQGTATASMFVEDTTTTYLTADAAQAVPGQTVNFTATVVGGTPTSAVPTGTVQFQVNGTNFGSQVTLDANGDASFADNSLPLGTDVITAVYSGDSDTGYDTTSGQADVDVESMTGTTTTLTSSGSTSVFGQPVTFTATLSAPSGTPTGTVDFYDGTTLLGSCTLGGNDVAMLTTSALAAGHHPQITAVYAGDSNFTGSTSATLDQMVDQATPTITWSNPSDITYGTALGSTQLDATANVAGTFSYTLADDVTNANGAVLPTGNNQALNVAFTPTDTTDYSSATDQVFINVNPPTLTLSNPGNPTYSAGNLVSLNFYGSDSDMDPLTYTASGLPMWLTINSSTGQISGTVPGNAATGITPDIVTVTATDSGAGVSASQTIDVTVTSPTVTLSNPGNPTYSAGNMVNLDFYGSDSDMDPLTYTASGLPTWLTINSSTGQISGTVPGNAATGITPDVFTVTATDSGAGVSASQTIDVTVTSPTVTLSNPGNPTYSAGNMVSLNFYGSDSAMDPLTYTASGLPTWLTINSSTGQISGTVPGNAATGITPDVLTVTATDSGAGVSASQTIDLTVNPPTVSLSNPGNQSSYTGSYVNVDVMGSDSDMYPLTYTATGLPGGLSIDSSTGDVTGTVAGNAAVGTPYTVTLTATDASSGVSSSTTISWNVTPPPIAPTITFEAQALSGHEVQLTGVVSADNPSGYTVNFSGAVNGWTTTDLNGDFTYVTTAASLGSVTATALDQNSNFAAGATANVASPAPTLAVSLATSATGTVTFSGQLTDVDAAGETVSFSGAATGSAITDVNGNFSFTTNVSMSGSFEVSAVDLWGQTSNDVMGSVNVTSTGVTAAVTPQITLNAQVLPGHEVLLTGTVLDNQPGGAVVTFSGAVSASVTADANGNFSLQTTQASLGTVWAQAVDQNGQYTNLASAQIAVAAPLLTMYVSSVSAGTATLSGTLADVDPAGETVQLGGIDSASTTTDANGKFSFTVSTAVLGNVSAVAADQWGLTSNDDTDELPTDIFGLVNFGAVLSRGMWVFQGRVIGAADPSAVLVAIEGMGGIAGSTVCVGNGQFSYGVLATRNMCGLVSAQGLDLNTEFATNLAWTNIGGGGGAAALPAPNVLERGTPLSVAGQAVLLNFQGDTSADGALTFSANNLPSGLSIDTSTGVVSGVTADAAVRSSPYNVTISAKDALGDQTTTSFNWYVEQASLTVQPVSVVNAVAGVGTGTVTLAAFTTPDQNSVAADFTATVTWGDGTSDQAQITGSSGSFTVEDSHVYGVTGELPVSVVISDSTGGNATATTSTTAVISSPILLTNPGSQANQVGDVVSLPLTGTDLSGGNLTWNVSGLPSGLTMTDNGVISGTVGGTAGSYSVTVTATDGTYSGTETFNWIVT